MRWILLRHLAGFGLHVAADDLIGDRVDGDLAGDVNEIAGADSRRIGAARGGYAGRRESFDHGYQCPSASRKRSTSMAAMQPAPEAVMAWR